MTRRTHLAALAVALVLAWLVGYPLLMTLIEALGGPAGWTSGHFAEFVQRPDEWLALWRSLWISFASVVLAALVGVPLAFLFERTEFPGRRLLGAVAALPVALPPLVGVIAFLFLYGESGFVSQAVQGLLGLEQPPWRLAGPGAILLVHAYSMYVYFYLFTRAGLARLDAALLEAAASLGAGRVAHPLPGDPAAPAAGPGQRSAADLHDLAGLVLGAVPLRRRLPGDDHADRRLEAQRGPGAGAGRDGDAGGARAAGAVGHAPHGTGIWSRWSGRRHRSARDRAGPAASEIASGPSNGRPPGLAPRRHPAAPARRAGPGVAGPSLHLDDRAVPAGPPSGQLGGAGLAGGEAAAGGELALDGDRLDARGPRSGVPGGAAGSSAQGRCRGRWSG